MLFIIAALSFLLVNPLNAFPTLDEYLNAKGVQIQEGYMTETQRAEFRAALEKTPWVKTIAEIGLNAGHSAENFFNACSNLEQFVSFDIKYWPYVDDAVNYLSSKYGERFFFVAGDSQKMVPWFAQNHAIKFDLIYIDGNHSCEGCLADIANCRMISKKETILWIDDYDIPTVQQAVEKAASRGLIVIDSIQREGRPWVIAHYPAEARKRKKH